MAHIYSVQTAIRLFKEESFDLALVAPSIIEGAARELEREGFFHDESDIVARFDDYQEEIKLLHAEALNEFRSILY